MTEPRNTVTDRPTEVLIAGGGVAGLESAFALRELAGDHVSLSILAPTDEFVYRPMSVVEPFAAGWAQHYRLAELADAANAALLHDALVRVDAPNKRILTAAGNELSYDALVVCLGASVHTRYEHATTVDDAHMDALLHGLVQDIEGGSIHRLAFVVPNPTPWPLPVYELALMTAKRAWEQQTKLEITVLTPEKTPLAIFGPEVSRELANLLGERNIDVVTSAQCEVPDAKTIRIYPGDRTLEVDRIVALPELRGPAISGLPSDNVGFIPIDRHTAVTGVEHVWAAGDAADFPIKHGGVSAQMADTAAHAIAASIGWSVVHRFVPVLDGVLLTGESPRHLRGASSGGRASEMLTLEHDDSTPKIAAKYLIPRLAALTPIPRVPGELPLRVVATT
jgi:sulfide:quinone oxidoreductase